MNNKINEAYLYAKKMHSNQKRKNGNPYIIHPENVAKKVKQYFASSNELDKLLIVAYLHDTLEDTLATKKEIESSFGNDVSEIVFELTNDEEMLKKKKKSKYLSQKLVRLSDNALNIKLCDRLDNVEELTSATKDFRSKYINETNEILNYLTTNRKLTNIQLIIVNDIYKKIDNLKILVK